MAGGALPLIVNPAGPATSSLLQSHAPRAFNYSCNVTAGGLAFGNYVPMSSNVATTSAIFTVACNWYTNVTITFSTGQSGTYTTRYMKAGGTDQLDYNIYTDTTYTGIVGNGTNGTYYYYGTVGPGGGSAYYYGLMPANQNVSPGSYSDTITVTVTY